MAMAGPMGSPRVVSEDQLRLVYNHCQKLPADSISSLQNPTNLMSIDAESWYRLSWLRGKHLLWNQWRTRFGWPTLSGQSYEHVERATSCSGRTTMGPHVNRWNNQFFCLRCGFKFAYGCLKNNPCLQLYGDFFGTTIEQ